MKLTVLTDNVAGGQLAAEHGLSYFVETVSGAVLFDTGHSDVFLKNAAQLGVPVEETNTVVLSHGHWDHGDGLRYLGRKRLICHPGVFIKRYRRNGSRNCGLQLGQKEVESRFDVVCSTKPYAINDEILFLGEIPRIHDFEGQTTPFVDENRVDDFVIDDSALAIVEDGALSIVTGCSHSGICNIIEHAKNISGIQGVAAVFGGFHLHGEDEQTEKTIAYFKANTIDRIQPSHCTNLPALAAFYDAFRMAQVKTGNVFEV